MNERIKKLLRIWLGIRRGAIYALLLLAYLLLQNVLLNRIALLGVRAMFMPTLVVAVALFEGGTRGGFFGLAAGVACDLLTASHTLLFTILYPFMGFVVGFLVDFFLNRRLFSYSVIAVLALLISALCQMFPLLVFQGQDAFALWRVAILQTLWSVPFVFLSYYLCNLLPRRPGQMAPSPY